MIKAQLKQIYYLIVKTRNLFKGLFRKQKNNKYLFILSPPYCGSTILHEVLSTSSNVSVNNKLGAREGQTLPGVALYMYNDLDTRWDKNKKLPWKAIKIQWEKYWDKSKPILLEKSPPNIIRASEIEKEFSPAYFLCITRNPYAFCESVIRKKNISAEDAARFVIECLEYQRINVDKLKNVLYFSYENFVKNTEKTKQKIIDFLPEISDMQINGKFNAHNYFAKKSEITDYNTSSIARLKRSELKKINSVFDKNKNLLKSFNY